MRNTRMANKRILKWVASGAMLALLFVMVFAGTLSGAFGIENSLHNNGLIENNVAEAAKVDVSKYAVVDLSGQISATTTSLDIANTVSDYYTKRGKYYTTDNSNCDDNSNTGTWSKNAWYMGGSGNHSGTDYGHCWFDFDLGNWYKSSDEIKITLKIGSVSRNNMDGYIVAIDSSDTQFAQLSTSDNDGENYYKNVVKNNNSITKSSENASSVDITHTVKGQYIRVYLVTYDDWHWNDYGYGQLKLTNISLTLTRTLKSYSVAYNKNSSTATGSVDNTSHKFMAASNISSNIYSGANYYFTGWNTNANGSGVAMGIGASTGTATTAGTFGSVVQSNLANSNTTTTLYAQWAGIPFTFNKKNYGVYNGEVLQVLQGKSGYLSSSISGFNVTIQYKSSNGSVISQPITVGLYTAIIYVEKDGRTHGAATLPFEIIEGDFAKLASGTGKWGSATNPYVIKNSTHLKNLSGIVNGTQTALNCIVGCDEGAVTADNVVATSIAFANCYFVLDANINMSGVDFVAIGAMTGADGAASTFLATQFDFCGYGISNITISGGNCVGVFGYISTTTIKNSSTTTAVISGTMSGAGNVGGLVGFNYGTLSGKFELNTNVTGTGSFVGGVVGRNHGNINNVTLVHNGSIEGGSNSVGGILGFTGGTLTGAVNSGSVKGGTATGGIVGRIQGSLVECTNKATVESTATGTQGGEVNNLGAAVGGITGYSNGAITDCVNTGNVIANGASGVGGIVGIGGLYNSSWTAGTVSGCQNTGAVTGKNYIGGVVGYSIGTVSNVTNGGVISGTNHVGGLVGYSTSATSGSNSNKVSGVEYVGGLVGQGNGAISGSNGGEVVGTNYIGGICGYIVGDASTYYEIESTINTGKITASANYVGGILGYAQYAKLTNFATNSGAITGKSYVGGLVGKACGSGGSNNVWIYSGYNSGKITSEGNNSYVGGIVGHGQDTGYYLGDAIAENENVATLNEGEVVASGSSDVGGIAGFFNGNGQKSTSVIKNKGNVTGNNRVGGIAGSMNWGTMSNVLNEGKVAGNDYVGGVLGTFETNGNLSGTITNKGEVSGANYVGGVAGKYYQGELSGTITNSGAVSASKNVTVGDDRTYNIVASKTNKTGNDESIDKINDNNNGTKYCSTKSKNASFVVDMTASVILRGFAIQNANDNQTVPQRTAKIVRIWGTNTAQSGSAETTAGTDAPSGWELIYSNSDLGKSDTNYERTTYRFSNFQAYRYYWIYIESKGTNNTTQLQFSEFDLIADNADTAQYTGGIAGWIEGTSIATGSTFKSSAKVSSTGYYVGGVFGYINNCNANATFTVDTTGGDSVTGIAGVGGAFGFVDADASINGDITVSCAEVDKEDGDNFIYGGVAAYNAGTINANITVSARVISRGYGALGGVIGSFVGGVIGYNVGTLSGTIEKADGDVLSVSAYNYVGGIVGYNAGTMSGTYKHTSNYFGYKATVYGGAYVGGIVGYTTNIDISGAVNNGSVMGDGSQAVGGIIGGLAGGASATIDKCSNIGAVTAENANGVAGIIGHTASAENVVKVTGCSNTGAITGKVNSGGIGGRIETKKGTAESLIFANCYNNATVKTVAGNTVGGILGYLYANTNESNVAKLTYCYSVGEVSSSDGGNFGAIVGNPRENVTAATVVSYCYTTNNMKISGTANATVDATNYVIVSGTTAPSVTNGGSYLIYANSSLNPAVISGSTYTRKNWTDITSENINGFTVYDATITPSTGQYFSTTNNAGDFVKPSKVENSNENAAVRDNVEAQKITAWYLASSQTNISCRVDNIAINAATITYDGHKHGFDRNSVTNPSLSGYDVEYIYYCKEYDDYTPQNAGTYATTVLVKIDNVVVGKKTYVNYTINKKALSIIEYWDGNADNSPYTYNTQQQGLLMFTIDGFVNSEYIGKGATFIVTPKGVTYTKTGGNTYNLGDTDSINAGTYGVKIEIDSAQSRNYSFEPLGYTWTINAFNLSNGATSGKVWFGAGSNMYVGNQNIQRVENKYNYYPLQIAEKSNPQALVYCASNYTKNDFVVYVLYNLNKKSDNGATRCDKLTLDNQYTLSGGASSGALDTTTGDPKATSVTASASSSNFVGFVTRYYTAMVSDFGGNYTGAGWGGESNPFVISHPAHLIRLSEIVNGDKAWNSINNTAQLATGTVNVNVLNTITDRNYKNAYFKVTAAVDVATLYSSTDGVTGFLPIGNGDHPFGGNFDGNGQTIKYTYAPDASVAVRDYVGLFGYTDGATLSKLKVQGTGSAIVGKDYVGFVVGYAKNTNITLADADALTSFSVSGEKYVGGVVGMWNDFATAQYQDVTYSTQSAAVSGDTYVGGLVGWLDLSKCPYSIDMTPTLKSGNSSNPITVNGRNCVGFLFGAVVGNGYHNVANASVNTTLKLNDSSKIGGNLNGNGGAVLGGLIGFVSKTGIVLSIEWKTSNITFGNLAGSSFVGGSVGMLGENATIESVVQLDANGNFITGGSTTVLNNVNFGADNDNGRLGSFVGGIAGYVTSSAGTYYAPNTMVFGNSIALKNSGSIYATSYAGGIFGAVGDFSATQSGDSIVGAEDVISGLDESVRSFIVNLLYSGSFAGTRSGNTLGIAPTRADSYHSVAVGKFANSASFVSASASYAGGIVGYVGANAVVHFENDPDTILTEGGAFNENGATVYMYAGDDTEISVVASSYAGGIVGYLSGGAHSLKYIVSRAYMGKNESAIYVGGIVGYMVSGTIEGCIAYQPQSDVWHYSSSYKGADYVGGIAGFANSGSITNCVTQSFHLASTTSTEGGILGMGINPTIESSWAIYVAQTGANYGVTSNNTNGKFVAIDDEVYTFITLKELVGFVKTGTLAFEVNVPRADTENTLKNKQLVFYNGTGTDTVTGNTTQFTTFENNNSVLSIGLDMASGESMQVYIADVQFVNVPQGTTGETEKVKNAYKHPSNSERYEAEVTTAEFTDKQISKIVANIYYNPNGNGSVVVGTSTKDNNLVGGYNATLTPGSAESPYTISTWEEWKDFATNVRNGTSYAGKYINLIADITSENDAVSNFAGAEGKGFSGTFNGNGHTIDIGNVVAVAYGTSLFPYANGATFKNLTIKGSITNTSGQSGTAGFVGIASESLTFQNCANQVAIYSTGRNVGGIVGQTIGVASTYNFIDCVNEAKLVNTNTDTRTSLGGIVGNIVTANGADVSLDGKNDKGASVATVLFESCRNVGILYGTFNLGGIAGRIGGNTTVRNCGNTAEVKGYGQTKTFDENTLTFTKAEQVNGQDTCVGGIGGLVTTNASINIYASFNSGEILGWGNKAGGILASDCEYTESGSTTKIYYCYNTGNVTVGGTRASEKANEYSLSDANTSYGVQGGGILGNLVNADVQYCYNTGTITGNGIVGELAKWRVRIGGIVGFVDSNSSSNKCTLVKNCYNVGLIVSGSWGGGVGSIGAGPAKGAGPIIGASKDDDNITSAETKEYSAKNYSITNACYVVYENKYYVSYDNSGKAWSTGNLVSSIDLMTAYMNASGILEMPGTDDTLTSGFRHAQSASPLQTGDIEHVANGGYIYVYGCLPQLAVFALDTQNGLAMTSVAYGLDQYGNYKDDYDQAGNENNPYVIKDGIDLLGMQSLVDLNYDFDGKYIEFANGENNLSKVQTANINYAAVLGALADENNAYKAFNTTTNSYIKGSSYHLLELGAAYKAFDAWKARNYYYNAETGIMTIGATFANQNIISISRNKDKAFHGSISGKQQNGSNTLIMHARISNEYAGLFDAVEDAYVGYISVYNANISSRGVAGGIVARPRGSTTIEHCTVGGTTTIRTYNETKTDYSNAVGGISGYATTYSTKKNEYEQGAMLFIVDCTIDGSIQIIGYKQNVGGILGTIYPGAGAVGKNNLVNIENCSVNSATITTTSTGSYIGGVLGYGSENIIVFIDGCNVGTGSGSVSINGYTSIGGIVGAMSKVQGGYVQDCTVGAKATIFATADCSNIGGLVGNSDEASGDAITMTFAGTNSFAGTINLNDKKANDIGGVIGNMGAGASFAKGSVVKVSGNITAPGQGSTDIGGVAGLTSSVAFSGEFTVAPTMATGIVENVGGFIGKNTGATHILAESTVINISGNISGAQEVGGFVGVNDAGASLVVGDNMYRGKSYLGSIDITISATIIGANNNVGGIVGKNDAEGSKLATLKLVKGNISTTAETNISGAEAVGGLVGLNDGNLETGGGQGNYAKLSITNGGAINGTNYVGGVFGKLNAGKISGEFDNSGSVTGTGNFVGGSIGALYGTISGEFDNSGSVDGANYVGGSIGYVAVSGTIKTNNQTSGTQFVNTGVVSGSQYFVGGSIGLLYGSISGTQDSKVYFTVQDAAARDDSHVSVNGLGCVGGSIGVIAGKVDYAQFVNKASELVISATTSVGGSVGYVGLPYGLPDGIDVVDKDGFTEDRIVISNSHFEANGNLTVNLPSGQSATEERGGVGGAIGIIGSTANSKFNSANWQNNTYYADGNVNASGLYNVGGVFGYILADGFELSNMLAYNTSVSGKKNVGGIVGRINATGVKISSAFALEGSISGENAGGIVGLSTADTDASTAYWVLGKHNNDIVGYSITNLTNLGYSTGTRNTGWCFLYANDMGSSEELGTINATHISSNNDDNLKYWKRIADAYSADERANGDDNATLNQSAIVKGGKPEKGTVYATATAAAVSTSDSGYYLYTATSSGANPTIESAKGADNSDVFYISISTSSNVGNFAVFYREIKSGKSLTYNGYKRIAVVGMEGVSLFTGDITSKDFAENERNKYYYTTSTSATEEGENAGATSTEPMTNAGTYKSEILIYFVDNGGDEYLVGGMSNMSWTIAKRDLDVKFEGTGNRLYGSEQEGSSSEGGIQIGDKIYKPDMKITFANIAPGKIESEKIWITVTYSVNGTPKEAKFGLQMSGEGVVALSSGGSVFQGGIITIENNVTFMAYPTYSQSTMTDAADTGYIDGGSYDKDLQSKTYTCYLFFKMAYNYSVEVSTSTNYNIENAKSEFRVNMRALSVISTFTGSSNTKYTYDTNYHGLSTICVNPSTGSSPTDTGLVAGDTVTLELTITQTLAKSKKATTIKIELENIGTSEYNIGSELSARSDVLFDFAGTYEISFAVKGAVNYSMTNQSVGWEIERYKVKFTGLSTSETSKVYDATAVVPVLTIEGLNGENGIYTYKNDTFTLKYTITDKANSSSSKASKIINVGKYDITVSSKDGKSEINATRSDNSKLNTSDNYIFAEGEYTIPYEITPRPVTITWNTLTKNPVYKKGTYYALTVKTVSIDGKGAITPTNSNNTKDELVFDAYGNDKITLTWTGKAINAGTYSMSLKSSKIEGSNDGEKSIIGNYDIAVGSNSYTIDKSKLYVDSASGSITKVYDGTTNVLGGSVSYTVKSSNGGDAGNAGFFRYTMVYTDKNVGNPNVRVTFAYNSNDSNYQLDTVKPLEKTVSGTITPASISVVLDKLRSGKATRVFSKGSVTYGGSGASANGQSAIYRTGEGFRVSGIIGGDAVTITAKFAEAGSERSMFDSYVNGVFKNADGTYMQEDGKYFKKLVFTMSGDGASNYKFNVYNTSNEAYGKAEGVGKDSTVTVYDGADEANKDNRGVGGGVTIEITVKAERVNYTGTYQSYANADNTYNTDWEPVGGKLKDGTAIDIVNGWMYANGVDGEKKQYTGYTVIKGRQGSTILSAAVSKKDGMEYNYRLSNQPTLTIAYVVAEGDEYKIDSLATLLIASFYNSASQNSTAPEFVQIVQSGYKWVSVVGNADYEANKNLPEGYDTWDAYFAKLEQDGYSVFLNMEASGDGEIPADTWGYYESTEDKNATIPTSFKQVKDISCVITASDIALLDSFFTVTTVDGNGNTTQNKFEWGYGKTYLSNLLATAEGSVATFMGSLFVTYSSQAGFKGTFDGDGYVIEYLNILGYGYGNVGLFDMIANEGVVKNVHLRNININANKGYVGGIAGTIKGDSASSDVQNVSWHGTINVSGTEESAYVGGLFGQSARDITQAMVLGSINSSNAKAHIGGVVGTGANTTIENVVSLMQINAKSTNTGAFASGAVHPTITNSYHMANAVHNGTEFVNDSARAKTYSELMAGSISGYGAYNKYYYDSANDASAKGVYDVLSDVALTGIDKQQGTNARQSMRLYDVVSVYLLMYSLDEATDNKLGKVYAISNDSWLVGNKHGTSAENDAIVIANKQNVSLLRELRFACFKLVANVEVEISSTFAGAFYGSVDAGEYKITCNRDMFGVYLNGTPSWLVEKANG